MNRNRWWSNTRARLVLVTFAAIGVMAVASALAGDDEARRPKAPDVLPKDKKCVDCHKDFLARKSVHLPVARNECEPCHEAQGDKHEFRAAAAPEEICTQCHEMNLGKNVHDPVAKRRCTECHDPHASDQPHLAKQPDLALCSKCHEKVQGARKRFVHGPFAVGTCQVCHAAHSSENERLLRRPGGELCLSCHEKFVPEGAKAVVEHAPAKDQCVNCHSGHESDVKYLLASEPPALCLRCHEDVATRLKDSPVRHKALSQPGGCSVCHEAHASRNARLLRGESSQLCLSCHDREMAQPAGARPLPDLARQLRENPHRHGPVREGACEGCHEAHAAQSFRLLKKDYPAKFYSPFKEENFALCLSCHAKEFVAAKESTATGFRDGTTNLHYLHVNRTKGRTCRACHATHASKLPHHLRETTPFGSWDVPVGFTETPTGGSCAPGCHTPQTYDREKKR